MIGMDILGADPKTGAAKTKDKAKEAVSTTTTWLKEHATYVGAGLGVVVGVLLMAFTGKHAGSRWTGKAPLPFMKKPHSALLKNGVGAVVVGTAAGFGGHALKEKEGW